MIHGMRVPQKVYDYYDEAGSCVFPVRWIPVGTANYVVYDPAGPQRIFADRHALRWPHSGAPILNCTLFDYTRVAPAMTMTPLTPYPDHNVVLPGSFYKIWSRCGRISFRGIAVNGYIYASRSPLLPRFLLDEHGILRNAAGAILRSVPL